MGGRESTTTSTYDSRYASADVSLLNYILYKAFAEVNKPFGSPKEKVIFWPLSFEYETALIIMMLRVESHSS